MFLMRSAFWLGLVFVYAPADPGDERREAAARAALFTGAVLQGAAAVMEQMPDDPARLCVKAPGECARAAQAAQNLAAAAGPRPVDKTQANRREPKQEARKPAAGGQSAGAKATVEQAETRRPQRPRDAQAPAARS